MKYFKILIFLILLSISGCSKTVVDELPKKYYINIKSENIEVYDEKTLNDIIESTNLDINKNVVIKTNKLGKNTYDLRFKIKRKKYLYHINYNVVDTTKPIVISSTKTIKKDFDNDLCTLISYGDNYDRNPICTVNGNYDINIPGVYNVSFSIKDNSNNELIYDMKLNVIDDMVYNKKESSSESFISFKDIYNNYKNSNTQIGIDVSKWQNDIDFKKVKEAGCEFVFIRIGVQKEINGSISVDQMFESNYSKAKEEGLSIGVYLYSMASSEREAKRQASWVVKTLDDKKLKLPVVFDWENFTSWNSYNLNFYDINKIAYSFLDEIDKNGYDAMLYSSKYYLENIWNTKYPVWLAHYTNQIDYNSKYKVWQITNRATINGINDLVDVDILYK